MVLTDLSFVYGHPTLIVCLGRPRWLISSALLLKAQWYWVQIPDGSDVDHIFLSRKLLASLILCYFNYACPLWRSALTETHHTNHAKQIHYLFLSPSRAHRFQASAQILADAYIVVTRRILPSLLAL